MTLGQRIQFHRTRLEFSQEGLGDKLGVSRQAVSKWEADGAVPDTDKLIALSKLFGITLNELLQVEEPVKPDGAGEGSAPEGDPPKAAAPAKRKWKGRLTAVLACLCLIVGMTAYTFTFGRMMGQANDRISELEWRVKELETRGAGLDPASPLVAGFDFDLNFHDDSIDVDLLPYQLPEGLEVCFSLTATDYPFSCTAQGERQESGHYTAVLRPGHLWAPVTITATFSDGVSEYASALIRITGVSVNSYSYETLWTKD